MTKGKMFFVVSLVMLMLTTLNCKGASLFMEAEESDNLVYYGNWVETEGWYIKRHSHASGGAFVVAHYPGAVMSKVLEEKIPAGKYRIFLRLVMTRSAGTKDVIQVDIGNEEKGKRFVKEASGRFTQDFTGSGYGWYQIEDVFSLGSPCDTFKIEAVTVENFGIGDDPEYEKPYVIIDSIIITSDNVELVIEKSRGRNELKFADGKDPRESVERISYPTITPQINYSSLPLSRKPFISQKNLLRNSSFEFNIKPFFTGGSGSPIITGNNVDNINLCRENPYHGNYCLKMDAKLQNLLTAGYEGSKEKPVYGNALSAYYIVKFLKNELQEISSHQPLVISYYLRTNGKKVRFDGKETSHPDWKRYSRRWKAGDNLFIFTCDEPDCIVYLDAVQIERGEMPTEYQPLEGIETGVFLNDTCAGIRHKSAKMPVEFSVSQGNGKPEKVVIDYRILDKHLDMEYNSRLTTTSKPKGVIVKKVEIPFSKLGSYLFVYEVTGHPETSYAIPFSVVEDPKKFTGFKPQIGAIISTNEEIMRIFKHAGFDWVNSLQDRLIYFGSIWPGREDMRYFHKYYRMWEEKYGIEYSFWRPPFSPPSWTKNIVGKEPAAHMGKPNIPYDEWEYFWKAFTSNVNYIKTWQTADELSYHRGPRESLKYIEIASRIIRKNIQDAFIMNSTQPRHLKEMLEINPTLDIGDAIGGSRHNSERNSLFYDRMMKQMTGKEYWVVGVGWGSRRWDSAINFETFTPEKKYFESRFSLESKNVQQSIFDEASIVGTERFGFYTAKFDAGHDPFSLFNGDNTINPFGVDFINSINFLRGHKPGNTILMDSAYGIYAEYLYRHNGKLLVMLSPDGSYGKIQISLDLPETKVQLYDHNLNAMPFKKQVVLPVSKNLYIEDNGIGSEKLLSAIKSLKAYPVNNERRIIMHSDLGDRLKLVTFQSVGGRVRMVSEVELPERAGFHEPIDQDRYGRNACWATVAKKVRVNIVTVDGNISEPIWGESAPSFIYCWDALDGSYGALQGIKDFSKVFSLKDISVTFRSLWDGDTIILALNVLDDKIERGDRITLKFDADILGNHLKDGSEYFTIHIEPFNKPAKFYSDILNFKGEKTGECMTGLKLNEAGYTMELTIPLASLKVKQKMSAETLGLGVDITDDDGEKEETILSWTTNYAPRKSPAGFGQIVLLK
jgi:hypothetical protein